MSTYLDETIDDWEKTYRPVKNHIDTNASWSGTMYETFGDEVDFVWKHDPTRVWTWVETEEGTFIIAGYHHVDRLGYFITEEPWVQPDQEIQVEVYGETCDYCNEKTDNGAGHFQDELGNDHPYAEDRLCTDCFHLLMESQEA